MEILTDSREQKIGFGASDRSHFYHTYRVSHLLVDLGLVDFYLGAPTSCPDAQPLLSYPHQPRQN